MIAHSTIEDNIMHLRRSLAILVLVVASGHLGNDVRAAGAEEGRIERNFVPASTLSSTVPAVPASAVKVFTGRLAVRIGHRNYELETLTAMPYASRLRAIPARGCFARGPAKLEKPPQRKASTSAACS